MPAKFKVKAFFHPEGYQGDDGCMHLRPAWRWGWSCVRCGAQRIGYRDQRSALLTGSHHHGIERSVNLLAWRDPARREVLYSVDSDRGYWELTESVGEIRIDTPKCSWAGRLLRSALYQSDAHRPLSYDVARSAEETNRAR